MGADSFFRIGSTHKVCQDYAIAGGKDGVNFAIISDGCSSSRNTDYGSRIISRIFANFLADRPDNALLELTADTLSLYADMTIAKASAVSALLGLSSSCLDATLLVVVENSGSYALSLNGDGAIAFGVLVNGEYMTVVYSIEYTQNYPVYLSYSLSEERRQALAEQACDNDLVVEELIISSSGNVISTSPFPAESIQGTFGAYLPSVKWVAVMSDGVSSFIDSEGKPVPLQEVVPKMLGFKNLQGEFVQRRMNRFFRDCKDLGWQHSDDFSIAAMTVGE